MDFVRILNLAQILVSIALIAVVLLQAKGRGLGAGGSTITHTRRGVEKTIFQLTIALAAVFVLVSALSVTAGR